MNSANVHTRISDGIPEKEAETYYAHGVNAFEELVLLLFDEIIETLRSTLLHTLEAEAQVYWQLAAERLVRFEDVEPAHDRAFIVGRAAADEAAGLLVDDKLEGLRVPSVALLRLQ